MESKQIAETVQKCGEYALKATDTSLPLYDDGRERQEVASGWMQAKGLFEIAFQLAVMNEREIQKETLCGKGVSSQSGHYLGKCKLPAGHNSLECSIWPH
jgi:hypothetical protein